MFVEVVMRSEDFRAAGFDGRDEIEDPLQNELESRGLGEVTGGGSGSGVLVIDVELRDAQDALEELRRLLVTLRVPQNTIVKRHEPRESINVYATAG